MSQKQTILGLIIIVVVVGTALAVLNQREKRQASPAPNASGYTDVTSTTDPSSEAPDDAELAELRTDETATNCMALVTITVDATSACARLDRSFTLGAKAIEALRDDGQVWNDAASEQDKLIMLATLQTFEVTYSFNETTEKAPTFFLKTAEFAPYEG